MLRAAQRLSKRWFSSKSSKGSTPVPEGLLSWLETAPVTVAQITGAGRGLVATQPIQQGQVILQEQPFLCVPAPEHRNKVCYACLKVLSPSTCPSISEDQIKKAAPEQQPLRLGRHSFCSSECLEEARASFFEVERHLDLQQLQRHCAQHGERFPLLALRLACMVLQHAASAAANDSSPCSPSPSSLGRTSDLATSSWRSSFARSSFARSSINSTVRDGMPNAGSDDGPSLATVSTASTASLAPGQQLLRRSSVASSASSFRSSSGPMSDLRFLCFANVSVPPPQPWAEAHSLLVAALSGFFHNPPEDLEADEAALNSMLSAAQQIEDVRWYVDVMSRLHINAFKVDAIMPFDWQDLASAAASAVASGGSGSSGSAIYLLASLFNHSCEPNVHVTFPQQDATAVFTAARDVQPGEQLTITYIDAEQDVAIRQEFLAFAYGFKCQCVRCKEEEAALAKQPQQLW